MSHLDPDAMAEFCHKLVPELLHEACGVDRVESDTIGRDILERAEAFAALDEATQRVLCMPFIEEVVEYEPVEASLQLKAAVTVVVRNSQLEAAHAHGPVKAGDLKVLTSQAAAPLSHLLVSRRRQPRAGTGPNLFANLHDEYPRAWAALAALGGALGAGGRVGYPALEAAVPAMPGEDEIIAAQASTHNKHAVVQSAIDPAFNQHLVDLLQRAIDDQVAFYVPSLSRISRHLPKLLRVIELLLARHVPILTTNYLLRSTDVWVRRGRLVAPDSYNMRSGLDNPDGLSGSHRKLAQDLAAQIRD